MNADLTQPAVVDTAQLPWTSSPSAGVERRRIERLGDEVARLTSLVRYAPGSRFPTHTHGGGEEYLVLEGVFSDASGDHAAGTYVRNGIGTAHAPFTDGGCTILVRLWWMHPEETTIRKVDTTDPQAWSGDVLALHEDPYERVEMRDVDGAHTFDATDGLELFVLAGRFDVGEHGMWIRRVSGAFDVQGTGRLLVRQGHLRQPPPRPPGV